MLLVVASGLSNSDTLSDSSSYLEMLYTDLRLTRAFRPKFRVPERVALRARV